jgi:hypothetical protein
VTSEEWSVTGEPDEFNARNIRRDMLPHVRDARKRVPPLIAAIYGRSYPLSTLYLPGPMKERQTSMMTASIGIIIE